MLVKNGMEPIGVLAVFEKQIEATHLPPISTLKSRIQVEITGEGIFRFRFLGLLTTDMIEIHTNTG
ncbi:MAG: hypothetical protein P8X74_09730 [Reinekea sp.]